jgi:hypothetical protein
MALPRDRKNTFDFKGIFYKKTVETKKINNLEGKNDEDGLASQVSTFFAPHSRAICSKLLNMVSPASRRL